MKDETLHTLDRGKPFDVLDVSEREIIIRLHSTGNERRIARNRIEDAWRHQSVIGELSRIEIEEKFSPRQPAYIAAILAELPGVYSTLDPIVLTYQS